MLSLLLSIIILCGYVEAINTIDSSTISTTNITCPDGDDCIINCGTDCGSKMINCASDYSCAINCEACGSATITAIAVENFELNCTKCSSVTIDVTLSSIDSIFELNCRRVNSEKNGCLNGNVYIAHIQNIYNSAITRTDFNTVNIHCTGQNSCLGISVDATINGYFYAKCDGEKACGSSSLPIPSRTMAYNPPMGTGKMSIDCIGKDNPGDDPSCYSIYFVSLSTRQIELQCDERGYGGNNPTCFYITITGPVHPFPIGTIPSDYSWDIIYSDSVLVNCKGYYCNVFVETPFGPKQIVNASEVLYYEEYDAILYSCGWELRPPSCTIVSFFFYGVFF